MAEHHQALLILLAVSFVAILGITLLGSGRLSGFQVVETTSLTPASNTPPPSQNNFRFTREYKCPASGDLALYSRYNPICKNSETRCDPDGKTLWTCKECTPNWFLGLPPVYTWENQNCGDNGCLEKNVGGRGPAMCAPCKPEAKCEEGIIQDKNQRTCTFTTTIREDCNTYTQSGPGGKIGACEGRYTKDRLGNPLYDFSCTCSTYSSDTTGAPVSTKLDHC